MLQVSQPPDDGGGIARRFERLLGGLDETCIALEELADSLPERIDTHRAVLLARDLQLSLCRCHDLEERRIFPAVLSANENLTATIRRLRIEHLADEDHAIELREAMERFRLAHAHFDAEWMGYMLRCLFLSLRRHTAYDREVILPLYRKSLKT